MGLATVADARNCGQTALLAGLFFFAFLERVIGTLFGAEREIGEGFAAQGAVEEENDEQREGDGGRVKNAANALPARL